MYIRVKVKTSAVKEKIEKINEDNYNISTREPAERNMANNRVCEMIAFLLKVDKKAVRIINGHHSHSKLLSIITLD